MQTSATEVFRTLGLDPKAEYPLETRLAIQGTLLEILGRQYADAAGKNRLWVSDRTPIDMAAYMLADIQRTSLAATPNLEGLVIDYVRDCLKMTNRFFSVVVLVQPGIPLIEEEGKAPASISYMEHLNTLMAGLMLDERLGSRHYMIPRRYLALDHRVSSLEHALTNAVGIHQRNMEVAQITTH